MHNSCGTVTKNRFWSSRLLHHLYLGCSDKQQNSRQLIGVAKLLYKCNLLNNELTENLKNGTKQRADKFYINNIYIIIVQKMQRKYEAFMFHLKEISSLKG